ncbi:hypothetical protein DY000_02043395 [Brassica cretica]|uniref:Uncharacterized protein n=1 Tax=Brassica cretica TaxID=69181 RepID=A0ABQ7BDY2_BRACR|nr:hypothetical protein DY000_02043395 [Brassica cretica]
MFCGRYREGGCGRRESGYHSGGVYRGGGDGGGGGGGGGGCGGGCGEEIVVVEKVVVMGKAVVEDVKLDTKEVVAVVVEVVVDTAVEEVVVVEKVVVEDVSMDTRGKYRVTVEVLTREEKVVVYPMKMEGVKSRELEIPFLP